MARRETWARTVCLLLAALTLSGCEEILIDDQMVEIDATGAVQGAAYVDRNGNESRDSGDEPIGDLGVRLVQSLGGEVASATTDEEGRFLMDEVPVGTYLLEVDTATLPDSLIVLGLEEEPFVVAADSLATLGFRVSFPTYDLAEVQNLDPGTRIFTSGIVLNPRDPLGGATVHLEQNGSYLRAVGVEAAPIVVGDSVRFQGRTALEAGLVVLEDVSPFRLREQARVPVPVDLTTAVAADADGGSLNAALARIQGAEILDTMTVDDDLVATVDDGSGPLDLVLRNFISFDTDAFSPGFARVEAATGLLVAELEPEGSLRWRLLPRFVSDVEVEEFPPLSIAQIRSQPAGEGVTAHGIVLNPVDQPTPGTIHIRDRAEGTHIRVREVTGATPLPGDSVRVRGITDRDVGLPVLDALEVSVQEPAVVPDPPATTVSAASAFVAGGGASLDAALVRVQSATVTDTTTLSDGRFVATIADGSGSVEVLIDPSVGFDTSVLDPDAPTSLDEVVGLLVPYRVDVVDLRWRIHPRFPSDIQVAP